MALVLTCSCGSFQAAAVKAHASPPVRRGSDYVGDVARATCKHLSAHLAEVSGTSEVEAAQAEEMRIARNISNNTSFIRCFLNGRW